MLGSDTGEEGTRFPGMRGRSAAIATQVGLTVSVIDKTAERGIIHKNAAARRKSRLMKRAHKAQNPSA